MLMNVQCDGTFLFEGIGSGDTWRWWSLQGGDGCWDWMVEEWHVDKDGYFITTSLSISLVMHLHPC